MRLIADNHCILFNLSKKNFGSLMGAVLNDSYKNKSYKAGFKSSNLYFCHENLAGFWCEINVLKMNL